jgi:hypothetical protein
MDATRRPLLAALAAVAGLAGGCDLTLTLDPATYADLDEAERAAADRIFARLQALDAGLRSQTGGAYALGPIAEDPDRVDVSVRDLWVMANLGDDRVHVSVWENLAAEQRALFGSWFGEPPEPTAARYAAFFYHFVGLHLGGLQVVYAVEGVDWVYANRSAFNVERDAERIVVSFLCETDPSLIDIARGTCGVIRSRFDDRWAAHYEQRYYAENFRELTDPHDPSGYLYFLCRHLAAAEQRRLEYGYTFLEEVQILAARVASSDTE